MFRNIVDDTIFNTPFDEVQLSNRCLNFMRCTGNNISKLFRACKWIEQFFAITIQTALVSTMYCEESSIGGRVRSLMLLGIIGDKPLDIS